MEHDLRSMQVSWGQAMTNDAMPASVILEHLEVKRERWKVEVVSGGVQTGIQDVSGCQGGDDERKKEVATSQELSMGIGEGLLSTIANEVPSNW